MPELKNARHEEFAQRYAIHKSATRAAKEAGFSERTAHAQGHRLLKYVDVAARVRELIQESFRRNHMERDEVLARLAMLSRADPRKLFNEDGTLRNPQDLDDDGAFILAGVDVFEEKDTEGVVVGYTKKVKVRDPLPALKILAEHHKIIGNTAEGLNNLANALSERFNRARERKRSQ